MASLTSILNPQETVERTATHDVSLPHTHGLPSPASTSRAHSAEETTQYALPSPVVNVHLPHPNCPDTLACLPDTEGRPQHTLPVILRCAILGSPKRRLTIREIYAAMEDKYPYYKTAGPTWKQSVRHHLSLNRLFERQPRPVTDPGFGSYWTVNLLAPPGTKRPRKRGRHNKDAAEGSQPPAPKRRGRPRKTAAELNHEMGLPSFTTLAMGTDRVQMQKCKVSAVRTVGSLNQDEEDELMDYEDRPFSEDECESEESNRFTLRTAAYSTTPGPGLSQRPRSSAPSSMGSVCPQGGETEVMIDRLRIEMAGLRRQSDDAVSLSKRMSDQLMEAQAEVSRAKQRLRALEDMLEEEGRKRREAERIAQEAEALAEEEAQRRRAVEEALVTSIRGDPESSASPAPVSD
ncbi:hypothetical protein NEOLEDRAFT_1130792 [Neolentinus lepideus HHB14362 ss-1]|uniref:Fork-head domain-containing protein n=1 Tax=Neolentinus lepideus HHB14362 ss-1 TaxID=1314782 RepID=A0A165U6C7_9AGAM|nr:hypothetical protein NEOLEDRAFT_1130792 [Neolentinus lepideus HHB14362 ss-1]